MVIDDLYNNRLMCDYLKPIAACQTKANSKKKTGITGRMSTSGRNIAYASGSFATIIVISIKFTPKIFKSFIPLNVH
jgi:hypothetical protein